MQPADIYQAVIRFLDLLNEDFACQEDAIRKLEFNLDQLAFAMHFVTYKFEPDWTDPPQRDYKVVRAGVVQRFPWFGMYAIPERNTEQIGTSGIMVGDAIDDITDIVCELEKVRWCWQTTSQNDALWHLEFGYQHHFRWHLRELQGYIHTLKSEV